MATQVNRLVGKYAVCHMGGLLVAQLVDWEAAINTTFEDGTAFGDYWEVPVQLRHSWSGRIGGFLTEASKVTFLSAYANPVATPYTDPVAVTFIGYYDHLTLGPTKRLIQGDVLLSVVTIRAPQGMGTQELQFRGIGAPTYIGNSTN
jgi:hypothetical protein